MTIAPLANADPIIQFHVFCAMTALITGPYALYGRKSRMHKITGYSWVIAMFSLAISSFFIHSFAVIGPFSPIHLLSLFTLWSLFLAMRHVFARRIALHRLVMRNLYWYGLVIAGLFNFLPGRTMNRMLFNDNMDLGYVVLGLGLIAVAAAVIRGRQNVISPIRA